MLAVYIASPYTKGDVAVNVATSMEVAHRLIDRGYAPHCPLLYHFLHMQEPRAYEEWMELDLEWIRRCDVVLRLRGESSGADREVAYARERGIPVVEHEAWSLTAHALGAIQQAKLEGEKTR